jgi:hypothetical protein
MLTELYIWMQANDSLLWALGLGSALMFVGSLILIPIVITRIPADYFAREHRPEERLLGQYPVLRLMGMIIKNLFGLVFLLAGIAMLILPGQGILSILIGISLMNFPGKRKLELRIISQHTVYKAVNWIRAKADKPSLLLPAK